MTEVLPPGSDIDGAYVTAGGVRDTLNNFLAGMNGGTVAASIAAGSTIGTGSTIVAPIITGVPKETSISNSITASTTQTLAGALALTAALNVVTTVGTAGDAVKLPAAGVANIGQAVVVINNGESLCQVFAAETLTVIDSHATAAAGTLTAAHRAFFFQNTASTWLSFASVSAAT